VEALSEPAAEAEEPLRLPCLFDLDDVGREAAQIRQ
jgi:hypothetical protein